MVLSNYSNFTSDGSIPIDPVPFRSSSSHQLISGLTNNSLILERFTDYFSKLFVFTLPNSVSKTYVITSYPIKIYERSSGGVFSESPIATLHEGNIGFGVGFVQKMGNSLLIGTRSINGSGGGMLYKTNNLIEFDTVSILPGSGATSGFISSYDQCLYIGIDGGISDQASGSILKYNGILAVTYKTMLDRKISSITGIDAFLFAGTSDNGYIYKINIDGGSVEIIYTETPNADQSPIDILSITTLGAAIFSGSAGSGIIMRSSNSDSGFISSFRTLPNDINSLKSLVLTVGQQPTIVAAVGSNLYSFRNTWTLEGSASTDILDFIVDENNVLLFCSKNQIKSIQSNSSSRTVFAKLIDNAGNETDIRSAPDEAVPPDGFNDNLTLVLTESQLSNTYLQSKILEVDNAGNIIYSINGDAPFYSAERIIKEVGVYYSDIFNGTIGHVSWGLLALFGEIPTGTSITVYARSSETKNGINTSAFALEFNYEENQDPVDVSFLMGQYLQVKIVLSSEVEISPVVSKIIVTNNAGSASHFFTNTFPLPGRIKRGIITLEKEVPIGSDIIIGVTGNGAVDFSQYQIIPDNRIFSFGDDFQGDQLKVGFRFLTPQSTSEIPVGSDLGSVGQLGSILSNSVAFNFTNNSGSSRQVDFKVEFFADASLSNKIDEFDSVSNPQLFRVNGNPFPSGASISVPAGFNYNIYFIPIGMELNCDANYYVRVSIVENSITVQHEGILPFRKICGTNFIKNVIFTYLNSQTVVQNLHFEVAFYLDETRLSLFRSFSSQEQVLGINYQADYYPYPESGLILEPNESSVISLALRNDELDDFDSSLTYYVTISYFDLNQATISRSVESMNFTFKSSVISSSVNCGDIVGAPILKGFAFMFELEDGRMIKFNYLS